MGHIKKRQCPSCGGTLIDDSEKQIYRCTSCGSSYDYDYFREEQLHELGETYLSRGEVEAAVDAYRLILKKAPHDFLALRGLMLAAAYLKDMDGLSRIGDAKHFSYDPQLVGEVLDAASEEDKEYFSKFAKIYADKQKQIDCNREIKSLHRERESIEANIRFTDNTRYEYYFETKSSQLHPKGVFIAVWCLTAFYSVPSFFGIFDTGNESVMSIFFTIVCGLSLLIGCGINFLIVYPKMRMINAIDADIRNLKIESEATAGKIRALETEAEELSDDIRKAISDLIRKDRQIVPDSVKEQVPTFGKIKQHQCPSCGGSLRIDSDKQMYHCTFCGSSYDYEYFMATRHDKDHILPLTKDYSRPDGVTIPLYYVDEEGKISILLTSQFRPAVGRRVTSIPAGLLDEDDTDILEAAKREALEEAGAIITDLEVLAPNGTTSSGLSDETNAVVLGRIVSFKEKNLEAFEDIDSRLYGLDEVKEMLKDDKYFFALNVRLMLLYLLERFK